MSERCEVCGRDKRWGGCERGLYVDGSRVSRDVETDCYSLGFARSVAENKKLAEERDHWKQRAEFFAHSEGHLVEQGIRTASDWLSEKQRLESEAEALREALMAVQPIVNGSGTGAAAPPPQAAQPDAPASAPPRRDRSRVGDCAPGENCNLGSPGRARDSCPCSSAAPDSQPEPLASSQPKEEAHDSQVQVSGDVQGAVAGRWSGSDRAVAGLQRQPGERSVLQGDAGRDAGLLDDEQSGSGRAGAGEGVLARPDAGRVATSGAAPSTVSTGAASAPLGRCYGHLGSPGVNDPHPAGPSCFDWTPVADG